MLIGALLLSAALILTIYNIYDAKRAEEAAKAVLPALQEGMEREAETIAGLEEHGESGALINPDREMPSVEIDGDCYIGILEIPSIGLTLPVMKDWSYAKLRIAPCLY